MSAFEQFVNLELPRRSAHLTVEITGYDADPNDLGAPAILQNAPKGTWYQRQSPSVVWYRKQISGVPGAASWVASLTGDPGLSATLEADCLATDVVGNAVYVTAAKLGGRAQVTKVDITSYAAMPAIGVIVSKQTAVQCTVQWTGEVAGIYSGLTPGQTYFVGVDGLPSASIPSPSADHFVQRLGVATDSSVLLLSNDRSMTKRIFP
jgi:hypothetical protein